MANNKLYMADIRAETNSSFYQTGTFNLYTELQVPRSS